MDNFLLIYLTIIGLLTLYWVLFGEKRFQQKIKNSGSDEQESQKIKNNEFHNNILDKK